VLESTGATVASQVLPNEDDPSLYTLVFPVEVPPMGFTTYVVQPSSSSKTYYSEPKVNPKDDTTLENQYLKVVFSASTGRLASITNKASGITLQVSQDYLWYNGSAGNNAMSDQASGAYIFRPNISTPFPVLKGTPTITFYSGPFVQEVRQVWNSSWVTQVVRLYYGSQHVEFESTIGNQHNIESPNCLRPNSNLGWPWQRSYN
jgi:hypothetical protein